MKSKIKDWVYSLLVFILSLFLSSYEFIGVKFILAVPIIALATIYKANYLFVGLIAMIVSAFIIDPTMLPGIVLISFALSYAFAHFLKKVDISLKTYIGIVGLFFGFLISVGQYVYVGEINANSVLAVSLIVYLLCYYFVEFYFELKSRENFSITKKQLMFLTIVINIFLGTFFAPINNISLHLIVFSLLNYFFIRLDKYTGAMGIVVGSLFAFQYSDYKILLFLVMAVYSIRDFEKNYQLGIGAYFLSCLLSFSVINSYSYLLEVVCICGIVVFFPKKMFLYLQKYIVDPQDYELKLYQQGYYKTLNHNKKIQKIMEILEQQLRENNRLNKNSREIILGNLEFLRSKLNEEVDIHLKDNILKQLDYNKVGVLSFKINEDMLGNCIIILENRRGNIEGNRIREIIEERLGVKLKLKRHKYNILLEVDRYVFVNDDKLCFNINIKQRSKDGCFCGDSYLNFNVKNKKYILLSDGMGCGINAKKDSGVALFLLKSFIELGMEVSKAIISCNAFIMDKDKENFNTLDLLEYNSYENTLSLYKNGSGATYLKKENEVEKLQSENLPLGIIDKIDISRINIGTEINYIVLTSDGIKKELTSLLKKDNIKSPKALVNDILENEGNEIEDDQTIVAINVIKSE